ncbi:MAG: hypothetical protein IJA69_00780, partial [Clostridia bacterium]|nr:hypothetical protein [Clostridia bacterium]
MEKTLYDLNLSQKVAKLQSTYTLFKRVINIIASATTNKNIDIELMQKAFNIVAERNDCLRIRFVKKNRKLKQYFLDKVEFNNIPYIEFKTKQEQEKFIKKLSSHVIKYKKGVVCEPYFCKTYDNKFMVLLKVAHLVLDIYGINYIFNDLFAVYDSLKNNATLPAAPNKFEDVLKKELEQKNTEQTKQKNKQFFQEYLNQREEPSYAGIHGDNCKLWQKRKAKNKKTMKMFMLKNDTQSLIHSFDNNLVENAVQYCKQTNCSMANLFFYTCSICASKLNNNTKHMLPMELVNYRSSALEKNCAG